MSTPSRTNDSPRAVPMLDVNRQNHPLGEAILARIAHVCQTGRFLFGPDCQELESAIAAYCQTKHAIGCASGSDALLLALMALGIGPGDEVILPSFTFFATAGAVWRLGAKPVFVDIDPQTMNLDPVGVRACVTSATKAMIPVHLFGLCADMTAIGAIARAQQIAVIEDAAQSIGAEYQGRRAGSLGDVGCFSFYPTKNLGGFGDGGMLTTDSDELAAKLCVLRDHGQQPRYHHATVGVNSRLDSIQAAVLCEKLPHLDTWTETRQQNALRYSELFAAAGVDRALNLPDAAPGDRHVWNQYTIRVPDGRRDALHQHLTQANVGSAIYYPVPLHRQECFAELGYSEGSLPHTEQAAREVLSLPIFPELTIEEQRAVVNQIAVFFAGETTSAVTRPNFLGRENARPRDEAA